MEDVRIPHLGSQGPRSSGPCPLAPTRALWQAPRSLASPLGLRVPCSSYRRPFALAVSPAWTLSPPAPHTAASDHSQLSPYLASPERPSLPPTSGKALATSAPPSHSSDSLIPLPPPPWPERSATQAGAGLPCCRRIPSS